MKRFLYCISVLLIFAQATQAQLYMPAARASVSVAVEKGSFLEIKGQTNVNSFTCRYKETIPTDTIQVGLRRSGDRLILNDAILRLQVDGFSCGNPAMNQDFQALLQKDKYPEIAIRIKSIEPVSNLEPEVTNPGYSDLGYAVIEFEIAGVSREYQIPVTAFNQVLDQYYIGTKTLNIKDFELNPPKKFLGLVKVEEEIQVDFQLNLTVVD